jgi:hypothetical protein
MNRRKDAIAVLNEVKDMYAEQKTSAYNVARVYAGLGERDMVMEWLERACEDHSGWVSWIGFDSEWSEYHGDPRFRSILKRVGLDKYWTAQAQ